MLSCHQESWRRWKWGGIKEDKKCKSLLSITLCGCCIFHSSRTSFRKFGEITNFTPHVLLETQFCPWTRPFQFHNFLFWGLKPVLASIWLHALSPMDIRCCFITHEMSLLLLLCSVTKGMGATISPSNWLWASLTIFFTFFCFLTNMLLHCLLQCPFFPCWFIVNHTLTHHIIYP